MESLFCLACCLSKPIVSRNSRHSFNHFNQIKVINGRYVVYHSRRLSANKMLNFVQILSRIGVNRQVPVKLGKWIGS